ncbi:hypothetical protein A2U01_0082710, partial [Trifolium medium]|nr:hypothetical protein [Trifolium medium]
DIALTSAKGASGTISRQQMIDDLKIVSKALDDKKFLVDHVIQALEAGELAAHDNGIAEGGGEDLVVKDSDGSASI